MNRREALGALLSLPEIARISAAPVALTDVIVVECVDRLPRATLALIQEQIEQVWPGRRVVVLDGGMTIKVVAGGQA